MTWFISPELYAVAIKNHFSPLSLSVTKQPTLQPRLWRPPGCQQQCCQSHLRGAQQRSDYRGSFGSDCSDPLSPCRSFPKTHSVKRGFQWYSEDDVRIPKTIMSDVLHLFIKNVLPGAFFVNLLSSSLSLWLWLTPFLSQWQVFPKTSIVGTSRLIWTAYISTSLSMVKAIMDLHLMTTVLDVIGHLMNVEAVLALSQSADLSREHQLAVWLLLRGNVVIVICMVIPIVVVIIIIILNTFVLVIMTSITCCNTIAPFNAFSNAQWASSTSLWGIIITINVKMKKKNSLPSGQRKRDVWKKWKRR